MPIIDACCGIGPWRDRDPLLPYTPSQILEILDYFDIEAALVHANLAASGASMADCQAHVREAQAFSPRFLPAFSFDPGPFRQPAESVVADAHQQGACGAVWGIPPAGLRPAPWCLDDIFACCTYHRLPFFLDTQYFTPDDIHALCSAFPLLRAVITGIDYRVEEWLYPLLRKHRELRACCAPAFNPPLGIERLVAEFGSERLLFGSGLPHCSPGGLIGYIYCANIADEDKQNILSGNVERLLREVTW